MDGSSVVHGGQAGGEAMTEPADFIGRHSAVPEHVEKRLAVDELHRQIGAPYARVDGEDMVANHRIVREVVEDRSFLAKQRKDRLVVREFG